MPTLHAIARLLRSARYAVNTGDLSLEQMEELKASYSRSRREFLKRSSTALAAVGVSSLLPFSGLLSSCGRDAHTDKTIAIIGGGIAGLACALHLKDQGIIATVYEGDKRTGGRIFTKSDLLGPGLTTELGGEFLDSTHTEMEALRKRFGLERYDMLEDVVAHNLTQDAWFFDDHLLTGEAIFTEFKKIAVRIADDAADAENRLILDNTPLESYIKALPCAGWLREILDTAYKAEYGLDTRDQSSLNLIRLIGTDVTDTSEGPAHFKIFGPSDERFKIKGGNQKITDALAQALDGQIRLEHRLAAISNDGGAIELEFTNGTKVTADFAVIAIPFTALRKVAYSIAGLSREKRACIEELGYGQNNKILLGMTARPWRLGKRPSGGYVFSPRVHNGWDNSQMQEPASGAAGYTVFLGGAESTAMAAQYKSAGDIDIAPYLDTLEAAFPGFRKSYSGKHAVIAWSNNPFVMGSYACFRPGQVTAMEAILAAPVGNIHFAGEHTSAEFQGFMEGGAESGKRAAMEILRQLQPNAAVPPKQKAESPAR